jgi:effector-binding domain-containing protein
VFDLDVGIPVDGPVAPAGHVRAGGLPGGRAARAVYRGPYEALASAWGELGAWIAAAGHRPGAAVWESYLVGPETTPDPAEWRTELVRLLDG